jgi:site-specific DNA-methyltransferase (adenine-specific)
MKVSKNGIPLKGIGYYTKSNSEFVLLGIKGKMPPINFSISESVLEPRGTVFTKPMTIRKRIEELYGDIPRIELFARKEHPGWDVWGDEVKSNLKL